MLYMYMYIALLSSHGYILSLSLSPRLLQALVKEDELMSRLEMLENQLEVYSKVRPHSFLNPSSLHVLAHNAHIAPACVAFISNI